jgi:hypothetical protein
VLAFLNGVCEDGGVLDDGGDAARVLCGYSLGGTGFMRGGER